MKDSFVVPWYKKIGSFIKNNKFLSFAISASLGLLLFGIFTPVVGAAANVVVSLTFLGTILGAVSLISLGIKHIMRKKAFNRYYSELQDYKKRNFSYSTLCLNKYKKMLKFSKQAYKRGLPVLWMDSYNKAPNKSERHFRKLKYLCDKDSVKAEINGGSLGRRATKRLEKYATLTLFRQDDSWERAVDYEHFSKTYTLPDARTGIKTNIDSLKAKFLEIVKTNENTIGTTPYTTIFSFENKKSGLYCEIKSDSKEIISEATKAVGKSLNFPLTVRRAVTSGHSIVEREVKDEAEFKKLFSIEETREFSYGDGI